MSIIGFILAGLILVSALWVVTLPNLFRAALSLGVVLLGVAGLFILLEAEFLAFVQILVYVGAILTLVVFAIMLTAQLHTPPGTVTSHQPLPAVAVSVGLFIVLTAAVQAIPQPRAPLPDAVPLATLGQQLVTTLVLPFEVISLVFVAALVGAIALARPRTTATPDQGQSPFGVGVRSA